MPYDDALELLRSGRQFLADEKNWCQRHAVHPEGQGKSILGAVGNRFYMAEHPATREATQLLARAMGRGDSPYDSVFVQGFNDSHTHAEVLELMDKAIALGEAEAAKPNTPLRAWRVVNGQLKLG